MEKEEERIRQIRKEYAESNVDFENEERAIQEREAKIQEMEAAEYARRESGTSGSVIPAAVLAPTGTKYCSGAVSGTDSESESEF